VGHPGFTFCPAGRWTRLFAGPSVGFTPLTAAAPGQTVRYRAITLNLPFYTEGRLAVGWRTPAAFGLPTLWAEVSVMPDRDGFFGAG
jgi:hypothetical protein